MFLLFINVSSCVSSLPPAAQDREQLKMELQQVNQQITQQTRYMEVNSLKICLNCIKQKQLLLGSRKDRQY